jgi:SAM-dependent methyltransferase
MKLRSLSPEEVLSGYDAVSLLYPHIPPMTTWRAWEFGAYRRYTLPEPVLDVGCGDGRFFQLVWPEVRDVVGVEMDPGAADAARRSGVYREVHVAHAHQVQLPDEAFGSAFANCSLEHMDHLAQVLHRVCRSLRPGAPFLFSVVTEHFLEWTVLSRLVAEVGEVARGRVLQDEYERYHHLVSAFPPEVWAAHLNEAGFDVEEHVPILPPLTSRLFLFVDQLWHVPRPPGELGDILHPCIVGLREFPEAFRQILAGVLRMEADWSVGSGAIFHARKRG